MDSDGLYITVGGRSTQYQYNQSFAGTTPSAASRLTSECTQSCGKWKFDVTVDLNLLVQLPGDGAAQSHMDLGGTTIAEHEEGHVRDFLDSLDEGSLNASIMTEGFTSRSACENARASFPKRLRSYLNYLGSYTSRLRDHYNRAD